MKHKRRNRGVPGWLQAILCLAVVTGATAGAGHAVDGSTPVPAGACVELQALLAGRAS
jgi:hypothetical protein